MDNKVQYWRNAAGRIELDSQQNGESPEGAWRLEIARGAKAVENLSEDLSRQKFEERKAMAMRNLMARLDLIKSKANECRAQAKLGFSARDAKINEELAKCLDTYHDDLLRRIFSPFDRTVRTSGFEMERHEGR